MSTRWFSIKRGDLLPVIEATLRYADGEVIDLTGATVRLVMSTSRSAAPKVAAAGVVVDAAGGVVQYVWAAGDTDTAGRYIAEWEVTSGGKTLTVPNDSYFEVVVTGDLPSSGTPSTPTTEAYADGVMQAHLVAADPHPQYLLIADAGDADPTLGGDLEGTASAAVIADGAVTPAKLSFDVATQAELDLYAPLASPTLTGTPVAPRLKLAVLDPSGAGYALQQVTGTFEAGLYNDTTMNLGYNVAPTVPGTKVVSTEPLLFLQFESRYRTDSGSPYGSEFHLNYSGTDPSVSLIRPINVFMEHVSRLVDLAFVADTFSIKNTDGTEIFNYGSGSWYMQKPLTVLVPGSNTSQVTIGGGYNSTLLLDCASGRTNTIQFNRATVPSWLIYDANTTNLYVRDQVNGRMMLTFIPAATAAAAYTDVASNLRVTGTLMEAGPSTNKAVVGSLGTADVWVDAQGSATNIGLNLRPKGSGTVNALKPVVVTGGVTTAFNALTSATTLTSAHSVVSADATAGAFTVTLPTPVAAAGRRYTVKRLNSGANDVTVACPQLIDGAASVGLTAQYAALVVVSNGAQWMVESKYL